MTTKATKFLDALTLLCHQHGMRIEVVSSAPVVLHDLTPGASPLDRTTWGDATTDTERATPCSARLPLREFYTQPFENVYTVTVPGTSHGFQGLQEHHITCFDARVPGRLLAPGRLAIAPESQDVTITFVIPESGILLILSPHSLLGA